LSIHSIKQVQMYTLLHMYMPTQLLPRSRPRTLPSTHEFPVPHLNQNNLSLCSHFYHHRLVLPVLDFHINQIIDYLLFSVWFLVFFFFDNSDHSCEHSLLGHWRKTRLSSGRNWAIMQPQQGLQPSLWWILKPNWPFRVEGVVPFCFISLDVADSRRSWPRAM
jgi:hypothetical protein